MVVVLVVDEDVVLRNPDFRLATTKGVRI